MTYAYSTIKKVGRTFLPVRTRARILNAAAAVKEWREEREWARLGHRMCSALRSVPDVEHLPQCVLHFNNGLNAFGQYRLIFRDLIYHFEAERPNPLILDCGSNIGVSMLYFKHVYPGARIIGFEPDPAIFPCLQKNVRDNGLADVELIQAALTPSPGVLTFYSDGLSGSCLGQNLPKDLPEGWVKYDVPCVRLRDYITEPVDFLKMNIEGAEWEALADCDERLEAVRQMVIEYHHWKGLPRTLHQILELLHRRGFTYSINHFDYDVNPALRPPFRLTADTRYYLMIFAKRLEE